MGKIKAVEQYEQELNQLNNDVVVFDKIKNGNTVKRYKELKSVVESDTFLKKKKEIESLKYKGSSEEKKEKQFSKLKRNKKLALYFSTAEGNDLKRFNEINSGNLPNDFAELEKFVKRGAYKAAQKDFKGKQKKDKEFNGKWEETDASKKFVEFQKMKESDDVKLLKSFPKSKPYKVYNAIKGSTTLKNYQELEKLVSSKEFLDRKTYLLDQNRFEKTEEFQQIAEFEKLSASDDIKLYLKYVDSDAFDKIRKWDMVFEDDFSAFNEEKWSTLSQMAQKGMGLEFKHLPYLHCNKGKANLKFTNSILTIQTKNEKCDGLAWSEIAGLHPVTMNYSSGAMLTYNKFSLKTGKVAVKVKANGVKGIQDMVALIDEDRTKMISMFSSEDDGVHVGSMRTGTEIKSQSAKIIPHDSKYYIIELLWTNDNLTWFANGTELHQQKVMGRSEAKFIEITSNVIQDVSASSMPHSFEIDWIKCYQAK